jgi:hypothetical protein
MRKLFLAIAFFSLTANFISFSQTSDVAKQIDKFGNVCCEDELARLDNFAVQLQNEPDAQGYIIFYEGRRYGYCYKYRPRIPRRGEAKARVARIKPYLVETRGFDANRIVVINGGYREEWTAELWIVPKGANPPKPTPTLTEKDIKFRRGKIPKGEYGCML